MRKGFGPTIPGFDTSSRCLGSVHESQVRAQIIVLSLRLMGVELSEVKQITCTGHLNNPLPRHIPLHNGDKNESFVGGRGGAMAQPH